MKRIVMLLLLLGARSASAQLPVPLVLHHLSLTIDSATFHEVAISPLMRRSFGAGYSGRDSTNGVLSIMGKYSFLQLRAGVPGAGTMIMLAIERPNGFDELVKAMGQATGKPMGGLVGSGRDDRSSAFVASLAGTQTSLGVFLMSDVAAAQNDGLEPENRSMRRLFASQFDSTKFLSRISSATIAIPVDDIRTIVAALRADNVPITVEGEGAKITLSGFDLHLIPPYAGAGVKQLRFTLTHEALGDPIYKFGPRSHLTFGPGATAVWDF